MRFAYVRVSTVEQNEERQVKKLEAYNIEKWFKEKVSAKDINRPQLKAMLEYVREGDVVYVDDFSRLARSTKDLLEVVQILEYKSVTLISLKENVNTSTSTGKLMLTMIGAINEFERNNLLERQREGIALAKEKGKYKGRKKIPLPANWNSIYTQYKERHISAKQAMELLGLSKSTFYRFIEQEKQVVLE